MTAGWGGEKRLNEIVEDCSSPRPVNETDRRSLNKLKFKGEHTIKPRKGQQMPTMEIVKAWKDEAYRDTLTAEQRANLPEHPSGLIEFGQPQLKDESLFGPQGLGCKFSNFHTAYCYTKNHGQCK